MIGLLQRVSEAQVFVRDECLGKIGAGLVVFVGVERADDERRAGRLLDRILGYRVFDDTRKGTRPSFTAGADPAHGELLFRYLLEQARRRYSPVVGGRFGAGMQVRLVNDGPATFWLHS